MPHLWQPSRRFSLDIAAAIASILDQLSADTTPEELLRFAIEHWPRVPYDVCLRATQIVVELRIADGLFGDGR